MKTNADEIIYISRRAHREAVALSGRDHSPADYKNLLKDVGATVEVFLKNHVYGGAHNRWNFRELIDGLEPLNVTLVSRTRLHALRDAYNAAKHDANYDAPMMPVIAVLDEAKQALEEIAALRLGTSAQIAPAVSRRMVWFGAWDHYIGGDTEISIFLPVTEDVDFPPELDLIYVDALRWADAKADLATVGKVCFGRGCIPEKFYDQFEAAQDFCGAGTFEGDIRDMIATFARYERVEDLLPFLKRENDHFSMYSAAIFAATDIIRSAALPQGEHEIQELIIREAAHRYAAPTSSKLLRAYAKEVAELIMKCNPDVRVKIGGPYWVSNVRYAELEPERLASAAEREMMVLHDGRLIIRI